MSRKRNTRTAHGNGTIRKKTVRRKGKIYTYWEARYTVGRDPSTGRQIQRSITGQTQKEVAQKLKAAIAAIDAKTYIAPSKMTVGEWLDIWQKNYLTDVKPRTKDSYRTTVETHLKPAFGAIKLDALSTHDIQCFYNSLSEPHGPKKPLSAKTIRNIHGVLHRALQQAVDNRDIPFNPTGACKVPKKKETVINPLDDEEIAKFLSAIRGHRFEPVYRVTLFAGLREGEVLGLTWDCVNFKRGTITVNKQLQKERRGTGKYHLVPTKNGKSRIVHVADEVIETLREQQRRQQAWRVAGGPLWESDMNLVFTDELGHHLSAQTLYLHFKKFAAQIGRPDARFHDLRHSYAVICLENGDDIKTLQENLGHHSAAFTLDTYGHVTEAMKIKSSDNMNRFIKNLPVL